MPLLLGDPRVQGQRLTQRAEPGCWLTPLLSIHHSSLPSSTPKTQQQQRQCPTPTTVCSAPSLRHRFRPHIVGFAVESHDSTVQGKRTSRKICHGERRIAGHEQCGCAVRIRQECKWTSQAGQSRISASSSRKRHTNPNHHRVSHFFSPRSAFYALHTVSNVFCLASAPASAIILHHKL